MAGVVVVQLVAAIAVEVIATTSLRASDGFTRLWPSVVVCACYPLSFYLLSLVLRQISIGVAYAVWSAVGTAAIVIIGIVVYGEPLTTVRIISLLLVVLGVLGLQLGGIRR
nr:multidrug efflux SMR transporter [Frankia sp. Cj3]